MKSFFLHYFFLNFFPNKLKINFLLKGKISKKPITSVKNPGIIKSKAAKAIAAPEITSYAGVSFCLIVQNQILVYLNLRI